MINLLSSQKYYNLKKQQSVKSVAKSHLMQMLFSKQSMTHKMNEHSNLKMLLVQLSASADAVERVCLQYAELRTRLQLEIYQLLQNNNNDNDAVTKIIEDI